MENKPVDKQKQDAQPAQATRHENSGHTKLGRLVGSLGLDATHNNTTSESKFFYQDAIVGLLRGIHQEFSMKQGHDIRLRRIGVLEVPFGEFNVVIKTQEQIDRITILSVWKHK